jgi:hypothetical protein
VPFKYQNILDSNEISALVKTASKIPSDVGDVFQQAIMSYALFAKAQLLGHNENKNPHITINMADYSNYKSMTFEQLVEIIGARKSSDTLVAGTNDIAQFYIAIGNWKKPKSIPDVETSAHVASVETSSEFTAVKTSITVIASNTIHDLVKVAVGITDDSSKNQFNDQIGQVNKYVDEIRDHYQIMYSILTSALDSNIKLLDQLSTELMVKAHPDPTVTVKLGVGADDTPITLNMLIA